MQEIEKLIGILSKLPNLGVRSARRIALYLIENKETVMLGLSNTMGFIAANLKSCDCGNIDVLTPCKICSDTTRDKNMVAIIESIQDLWALERSSVFKGRYFVFHGINEINKMDPEHKNKAVDKMLKYISDKIKNDCLKEVIIATNVTLDGQMNAFFIKEVLENLDCKVSRIASGVPVGGELDYLDEGTISAAISSRRLI